MIRLKYDILPTSKATNINLCVLARSYVYQRCEVFPEEAARLLPPVGGPLGLEVVDPPLVGPRADRPELLAGALARCLQLLTKIL